MSWVHVRSDNIVFVLPVETEGVNLTLEDNDIVIGVTPALPNSYVIYQRIIDDDNQITKKKEYELNGERHEYSF